MPDRPLISYADQLLGDLDAICTDYAAVLQESAIVNVGPNRSGGPGMVFIGFAHWGWAPSSEELQARRMAPLARIRSFRPGSCCSSRTPPPRLKSGTRRRLTYSSAGSAAGEAIRRA